MKKALAVLRGLLLVARHGGLRRFAAKIQGSAAAIRLSLFLALPELRGTWRLTVTTWRTIGYRLWNDLDFDVLPWEPHAVRGEERLRECLADGGGALVCSFHYGAYRRAACELVRRGFEVVLVVDDRVASTLVPSARQRLLEQRAPAAEIARFDRGFSVLDATRPGMVGSVFAALDRNAVVMLYLDGNTGACLPGTGPAPNASEVRLFGQRLRIRHGICQIAAARRIPILPLFARWDRGLRPAFDILPPLFPPADGLSRDAGAGLLQTLFALAEERIRRDHAQFEHWIYLHRWQAASGGLVPPAEELLTAARQQIEAGGDAVRYRLDFGRVLLLRLGGRRILADAVEGRIVEAGRLLLDLTAALRRGLSWDGLRRRLGRRYPETDLLTALARLKASGLVAEARD